MKRIISVALALAILLSLLPVSAFAVAPSAEGEDNTEDAECPVNWMDVVYAYPSYLYNDKVLFQEEKTLDLCEDIFNSFSGGDIFWASLEETLSSIGDFKKLVTTFSDANGWTTVMQDGAADKAVMQIMKAVYEDPESDFWNGLTSKSSFATLALEKAISGIGLAHSKVLGGEVTYDFDIVGLDDTQCVLKYLCNQAVYETCKYDTTAFDGKVLLYKTAMVDDVFDHYKDQCKTLGEAVKIAETLASILFMINIEDELINYLLSMPLQQEMLDSLKRLKTDIGTNFGTYFYRHYIANSVIDKICSQISELMVGGLDLTENIIKLVCSMSQWLLLDVLFPHADGEDIFIYIYLCRFAYSLKEEFGKKTDFISTNPITNSNIEDFEYFYPIYIAALKAAVSYAKNINPSEQQKKEIAELLAVFDSSNADNLFTLEGYKKSCVDSVNAVPKAERKFRNPDYNKYYTIEIGNVAISDCEPEDKYAEWIYPAEGRVFYGFKSSGSFLDKTGEVVFFPSEKYDSITIIGNIDMNAGTFRVKNGAYLMIDGDCRIAHWAYASSPSVYLLEYGSKTKVKGNMVCPGTTDGNVGTTSIEINGDLEVVGDITVSREVGLSLTGNLTVGGNVSTEVNPKGNGTLILNGDQQQKINGKYYNVVVKNTSSAGVSLWGTVVGETVSVVNCLDNQASRVNDTFTLTGGYLKGPYFNGTINSNGAVFKENVTVIGNINQNKGFLRVPKNVCLTVTGNLTAKRFYLDGDGGVQIDEGGKMIVKGNVSASGYAGTGDICTLHVFGKLIVGGELVIGRYVDYKYAENVYNKWEYSDGVLYVFGTDSLKDRAYDRDTPWYSFRNEIKNVIIDDGISYIGTHSFEGCANLESIVIPDSVTQIGSKAFKDCVKLNDVSMSRNISSSAADAFAGTAITENQNDYIVVDGILLNYTGEGDKVTVPAGVTAICDGAFDECGEVTSITLPPCIEGLTGNSFSGCSNLQNIYVSDDDKAYSSFNGILYNADMSTLICCPRGKTGTVVVPDTVKTIGSRAFNECTGISEVIIPQGVTRIGSSAFSGCTGLTRVSVPESITSIEMNTFRNCRSLTDIALPSSVAKISIQAFSNCVNLNSISIPRATKSIGLFAFSNCPNLKTVYYSGTEEEWKAVSKSIGITALTECTVEYNQSIHVHVYAGSTIQATCTEKGCTVFTCVCGDSITADYVDALGHNFVDGKCARCGEADPDYRPVKYAGRIAVSDARARAGEEVTVFVSIEDNPGITVMALGIDYDKSKLELVGYEDGIMTDWEVAQDIARTDSGDVTEDGVILKLKFKVIEAAVDGDIQINVLFAEGDIADNDEMIIMPSVSAGKITVYSAPPGDVSGDGNADALDLIRLQRYLAGEDVVIGGNCDITGDGKTNALDLIRLQRFLAGEDVEVF